MAHQEKEHHEPSEEALALLEILAMGQRQIAEGKVKPAAEVVKALRKQLAAS